MGVNINNESLEGTAFANAMRKYDGTNLNPGIESNEWKEMQACVIGVTGERTTNAEPHQVNSNDAMTKRILNTFESARMDDTELSENEKNYAKNDVVCENVQTTKGQPNETIQNFDYNSIMIDPAIQDYTKIGLKNHTFANENNTNDNTETHPQRMSKDEYYLGIAEAVSKRSNCLRLHYGSVIVNNDRIISTGYNGAPRKVKSCMERGECYRIKNNIPHFSSYDKCFSVHSEQNALIHSNYEDMIGGTLYLVGIKPDGTYNENTDCCDICKRMIRNAQISRVVMATGPNTYKIAYPQTDWFQFKDEE